MGADRSAYAVLGLEPGAGAAEVERAYRRLIKQYHPDTGTGDAARAAELNQAYRQLRHALKTKGDIALHQLRPTATGARPGLQLLLAPLAILAAGALLFQLLPAAAGPSGGEQSRQRTTTTNDIMSRPLDTAAIDAAVVEAVKLSQSGDEMALTGRSRACHAELRLDPALKRFDRCVAFDDAVVRLQDRDPFRDRGTFSQLSVTGRHWAAAAPLSSNYLATDSRLKQIRVKVEILLAPAEPRN